MTDLAAALIASVPRYTYLSDYGHLEKFMEEAEVLAALTAHLDAATAERAGEVLEGVTPGPWEAFIDDSGGRWTGWPLSIEAVSITDKTVVRTGGQWPYEWDAKTSQEEAVSNARFIAWCREGVPALLAQNAALRARIVAMEHFRPIWAHGWTDDSVAAQASGSALAQLWQILGASNQTEAVTKLRAVAAMLDEADREYNRKTNDLIERHAEQLAALRAERDSLLRGHRTLNVIVAGLEDRLIAAEAERDALQAERDALAKISAEAERVAKWERDRAEWLKEVLQKIADMPDYRLPKPQDIARAALTTEERHD